MKRNHLLVDYIRGIALGLSLLALLGGGLAFHPATPPDVRQPQALSAPATLLADDKGGKTSGVETHGLRPDAPGVAADMPVTVIADGVETHGKNDPPPSGGKGRAVV